MKARRNENTGTWHLIGRRGCGTDPDGEMIEGNWAEIRDRVDRDAHERRIRTFPSDVKGCQEHSPIDRLPGRAIEF
ncbi:MAG: hypothetical protein ABEI52_09300 [Halobacteriaceae archaeon]